MSNGAGRRDDGVAGHVFISYSRDNRDYVQALVAHLRSQGLQVWFDDSLHAGTSQWVKAIESAIEGSIAVVPIMSRESDGSAWVDRELDLAQELHKPIVPLLLSGRCFLRLRDRQYEDVTSGRMPGPTFTAQLISPPSEIPRPAPVAHAPQPQPVPPITPWAHQPQPGYAVPAGYQAQPYYPVPYPQPEADRVRSLTTRAIWWSIGGFMAGFTLPVGWVYAIRAFKESRRTGRSTTRAYVGLGVAALMTGYVIALYIYVGTTSGYGS
jgi:hypothetical protein